MVDTMRAYEASPDLQVPRLVEDQPVPAPGPDEVLVKVHAVALNNADLATPDQASTPGFELSGEVVAAGDGASGLVGHRVMGIAVGAFAEYAVAHRRHVIEVPENIETSHAATLPVGLTTELGAVRRSGLTSGSSVLITAAASGIGLLSLQVARAEGASTIIATTRNRDRRDFLLGAGADHVIVTSEQGLAEATRELTGGGVEVSLDHVGGALLDEVIAATRIDGTVVSVGRLAGPTAEIDLFTLAARKVHLSSVSYGLTPPDVLGELFDGLQDTVLPALRDGAMAPVVDSIHPFEDIDAAMTRLRSGQARGKIVLTLH